MNFKFIIEKYSVRSFLIVIILMSTMDVGSKEMGISLSSKAYVPDQVTAIKVAEAIWLPIYGKKIYEKSPFTAKLQNDTWIVNGTLPKGKVGGVPYIIIQMKDCKILDVYHTK